MAPLRHDELYAQTHHIGDHYLRQYGQEAVGHKLPEREFGVSRAEIVLVAAVVHAEEQTGQQSHHNDYHHSLGVESVVDMHSAARSVAGRVEECLHTVKHALQRLKPSSGLEMRPGAVEIFFNQ